MVIGVFRKQDIFWIGYYINSHCKWERIGLDERPTETILCQQAGRYKGGTVWGSFDDDIRMAD
jgi:hypothetical protein